MVEAAQEIRRHRFRKFEEYEAPDPKEVIQKNLFANDLQRTVFGVQNLKVGIVGDSGTGKTTFLKVIKSKALILDLPKLLDNFYVDIPTAKPGKIDCHVYAQDTDGNHSNRTQRTPVYLNSDVMIVCFAIDDRASFNNVYKRWYKELKKFCPQTPFILMGTKCDWRFCKAKLREFEDNGGRLISEVQGIQLHHDLGAASYIESSSYSNIAVHNTFQVAVNIAFPRKEYKFEEEPDERRSSSCIIL